MQPMLLLRRVGLSAFLGLATLALPLSAHAGGIHVDIGFEIPVPVVIPPPPVVYERWLPPGIAKKYYRDYYKPWKHYHHDED